MTVLPLVSVYSSTLHSFGFFTVAAFFLAVIYAATTGILFLFVILLFSREKVVKLQRSTNSASVYYFSFTVFGFETFALSEPVSAQLQVLSYMLANEIPVLSTILYYEMNGLVIILGFTLFTTLLTIILVLAQLQISDRISELLPFYTFTEQPI